MDATMLRSLVELQPASHPADSESVAPLTAPRRVVQRTYPGAPTQENASIALHSPPGHGGESIPNTPRTEAAADDLEMRRPASPGPTADAVDAVMSVWDPSMNRFRLLSLCLCSLGDGLSDSAAGALIPYMETYYKIGYGVVSLIFVGQALGFVAAAVVLDTMRARLGRARLLAVSQACMALGYVPLVATGPFVLVILAFFLVGFGLAINVAVGNTFCGALQNGTLVLGLLHGTYGIGGISGPLVATALVAVAGAIWSRYYIVTLGVVLLSLAMALWSFWSFEKEQSPAARAREAQPDGTFLLGMMSALKLRVVLLGAIFIFAYQGAEVSISGWVISFLINVRDGDPSSVGYVSSGFWAGITAGRFFLSGPAQRIGEKRFVYGLVVGAIAFQILVWLVPNIVGNAVAVSIVGLLLGPVYPCSAAVFMRAMSHRDALSGMGTISACGSLGGAVAPFFTGMLAQAVGTYVLHPIVIGLFVVMLLCWYAMPVDEKRSD
ncbi:MFS transporter [Metarhizium robertsii]|uniref:Major facilitator superfamily domain protein n=2 Tax=Metarhizium robertsii TaxID=568076 RepID=E9F439_METRA|nr:Major facilitator superfamily domain protein [Metarhizium robertsii ARSEF 23]EFY97396.1 Major facilitator superfamily domain protein [Metarhizium robertsii ARSEF 23]EXU96805.1 MFS transporter [Metarhizium robertsii]